MMGKDVRAFTLIELLVVVLIIAILAAVALPQYQHAIEKSRYAEAELLGRKIFQAEKLYFLSNGVYTDDFSKLDLVEVSKGRAIGGNVSCGFTWFSISSGELSCKSNYGLGNSSYPAFYTRVEAGGYAHCRCSNKRACRVCQAVTGKTSSCVPSSTNYCVYYY